MNLNQLKCPCSNVAIAYHRFISLSPIFHHVCSSDFVSERWIALESTIDKFEYYTAENRAASDYLWAVLGARHFRLLSALCKLASNTTDDAVHRLNIQSLVSSNVLTQTAFNAQLNSTITQFLRSLIIHFRLLVDTTRLFTQADQPYTKFENAKLILNTLYTRCSTRSDENDPSCNNGTSDEVESRQPLKVRIYWESVFIFL